MLYLRDERVFIVGPGSNRNDTSYKPSFLTDQELKHLVLEVGYCDLLICLIHIHSFMLIFINVLHIYCVPVGRRSSGLGSFDPLKICRRVRPKSAVFSLSIPVVVHKLNVFYLQRFVYQ